LNFTNNIYPKVLDKILVLLKSKNYVIFFYTQKEFRNGSLVQFSTSKLANKGKFAKNRQRFEIRVRKDGIKFEVIAINNRVLSKYSTQIMTGSEFKNFCREIPEASLETDLAFIAEQIYEQFEVNYLEEKIDQLILQVEAEI